MVPLADGPIVQDWQQKIARLRELQDQASKDGRRDSQSRVCETCRDTGWESLEVDGVERLRRCSCAARQACADGIPVEFRTATLENFETRAGNETAVSRARKFLDGTRDLVLVGGVGAGKTRLACSILNMQPSSGFFVRVPMLLHSLEPGRDVVERQTLERRLRESVVVVLDDLAAERDQATDFTRRTIWMIYEARHDRGLRTIWTTNKTLGELAAMQADDRLTSRLAGWADVVLVGCADQRVTRHLTPVKENRIA
jgi:DNA replication protein DnaC